MSSDLSKQAKTAEEIRSMMVEAIQKDEIDRHERARQYPNKRIHLRHRNADYLGKEKWVRLEVAQQLEGRLNRIQFSITEIEKELARGYQEVRSRLERNEIGREEWEDFETSFNWFLEKLRRLGEEAQKQ